MRAGLPDALRIDFRRQTRAARRPEISVKPPGSGRTGGFAGIDPRRRRFAENRRPAQVAGYVANITRIYRNAWINFGGANYTSPQSRTSRLANRPSRIERYDMEMAFCRGLHTGWFGGTNNQQLVHARFGKKRGVYLGEVTRVLREGVLIRLEGPLKPGDGVVFDAGKPEENEEGGRVYEIRKVGRDVPIAPKARLAAESKPCLNELRFGHGDIDFSRIHVGDKLWKTSDPELDRRLRQSFEGEAPKFQGPIEIEVHGVEGKPLTLIAHDEFGNVAKVESTMPLAKAEKQPLTTERLREQLGRLGGTPFKLGELKNNLSGEVLLPVSELNRLRREVTSGLERQRVQPKRWKLKSPSEGRVPRAPDIIDLEPRGTRPSETQLIALVRNPPQLEAALSCGVTTIYCEFEDPKKYREAVTLFHTAHDCHVGRAVICPPTARTE